MDTNNFSPLVVCCRLTLRCNLNCNFCLSSPTNNEISYSRLDMNNVCAKLQKLHLLGTKKVRLCGGEPTLRKDIIEIMRFSEMMGFHVTLCTNLLNIDHLFHYLTNSNIVINTSIHGNRDYHNRIVGMDAYDTICHNIKRLSDNGIIIHVHYVYTIENKDFCESAIEEMLLLGAKKITFQSLLPRGKGNSMLDTDDEIKRYKANWNHFKSSAELLQRKFPTIIVKTLDLYEKAYYVLGIDGQLYIESTTESEDFLVDKMEVPND